MVFKKRSRSLRKKSNAQVERHRYSDVLTLSFAAATSQQVNANIYSAAEISTSSGLTQSIPCKLVNFKIQFVPGLSPTVGIYGTWALVYVPKGQTPNALSSGNEIYSGDKSYVIDSGTFYQGPNNPPGYLYMYEPKVSRKLKGGDQIYLCVGGTSSGAGSAGYTYSIDFTVVQ